MSRRSILILLCPLLLSCENTATNEPETARGFPPRIAAIIESNCLGGNCHSQPTLLNDSLVLTSWEQAVRGSETVNDIIPFHARLSQLFLHINADRTIAPLADPRMPLSRNPLSTEDQRAIFDWIESGAQDKDGRIPYRDVQRKAYVANQGADYITYIDADSRRLIGAFKLPQGFAPSSVLLSSDKTKMFTASAVSNGVIRRYSTADNTLDGEFECGLTPYEIVLLPNGEKGYIANYPTNELNRLGVFDPVGMSMTRFVETPLVRSPRSFAVSGDGKYLYAAGYDSDNILRIDTQTDSVVSSIRLGSDVPLGLPPNYQRQYAPAKLVLSKDGTKLFASCLEKQEVVVLDLLSDSVIARISVQFSPYGIAATPNGSEVWVANTGSNSITIIDAASLQTITTLDTIAAEPRDIRFTSDGMYAYIACHGLKGASHHIGGPPPSSVIMIETATRKIVTTIELPTFSVSVALGF